MFEDLRSTPEEAEVVEEARPSLVERLPILRQLKPRQRLLIALLLFMNVAVLGCGCLLAFDRMVP